MSRAIWLVPVLLVGAARADEPDPELVYAEKALKDADVATDGASLLRFFRQRTLTEDQRADLVAAVRRLGDDDFDTREQAAADLIRAGRKALPLLRPALRDDDRERARRAEQCVQEIESGKDLLLAGAAARVLAERRPDGAAAALLGYLPSADDEATEDALLRALATVGVKDGVPDAVLPRALTDAEPLRRAAAARVLGRAVPGQREAVRKLLADADSRVRFEAAAALIRANDRSAVPVLLALVGEGPLPVGWKAVDVLQRIAGEKAPPLALTSADGPERAKVRDAWERWWKDAGEKADLSKVQFDDAFLGLTLICEVLHGTEGVSVWECGPDARPRWKITNVKAPCDAQVLPGGRVLIAEAQGQMVTERDLSGNILWKVQTTGYTTTCQRLPSGNTFIATYSEIREVTREGKDVFAFRNPVGGSIYRAQRMPNGHVFFVCGGAVVELDAFAKQVRSIKVPGNVSVFAGLEVLPGDRFLVALYGDNRVVEMDAGGKLLWQCSTQTPSSATRLPSGNTLVTSMDGRAVIEFDRAGNEVSKIKTEARPFRVRRY
jgi:HEAT repeat protein